MSAVIETMSADELVKELVEKCDVIAVWKNLYPLYCLLLVYLKIKNEHIYYNLYKTNNLNNICLYYLNY